MTLIDEAIVFAAKAHQTQLRKGTDIPYITHPFGVAMLLQQAGCKEDLVIAGLLHDTVEDTFVSRELVRQRFGTSVEELVWAASEPDKTLSWLERKQHTIRFVAAASLDVKLLSCADKLHNLRSILADLSRHGSTVWSRFNQGREEQVWYYTEMYNSFLQGLAPEQQAQPLFAAYRQEVSELHCMVDAETV